MPLLEAPGDLETCPHCQVKLISPSFLVTIPQGSGKRCRVDRKAPMVSYKIHNIRLSNRESLYSELCYNLLSRTWRLEQTLERKQPMEKTKEDSEKY